MTVLCVLGLGEAGGQIAPDLAAAGATVRAFDPKVAAPSGISGFGSDAEAASGAAIVLALTSGHEAMQTLQLTLPGLAEGVIYADLNTASAGVKIALADTAGRAGVAFADVAMMAPVPSHGLRTPMLASGPAAGAFAAALNSLGGNVTVLPGPAGAAAARKLIRSVFYKGLAAAVTEALAAARAADCEEWLRADIGSVLADASEATVDRLEHGSIRHARRRTEEMAAAAALLGELGVPARIATASHDWLEQLMSQADGR